MTGRLGIAEWYGEPFIELTPTRRRELAQSALQQRTPPRCPFQADAVLCSKPGGVCSQREYRPYLGNHLADRIGEPVGPPIIMCPKRFEQDGAVYRGLAEIVGFEHIYIAQEVPFMRTPGTNREAGRMDLVLSGDDAASEWYGLEIQAVYFSGGKMETDFRLLSHDEGRLPPAPTTRRRPDWRSSTKRLMSQLIVEVPLLRQWGKKMTVAVDTTFFGAIGGNTPRPSHDLNDGDVIWLTLDISEDYLLQPRHWEVLSLETSTTKLQHAETIKREEFESTLRKKLRHVR